MDAKQAHNQELWNRKRLPIDWAAVKLGKAAIRSLSCVGADRRRTRRYLRYAQDVCAARIVAPKDKPDFKATLEIDEHSQMVIQ